MRYKIIKRFFKLMMGEEKSAVIAGNDILPNVT